jgi:hypothetical protein
MMTRVALDLVASDLVASAAASDRVPSVGVGVRVA